jgi:hypothetical protein
MVDGQAPSDRRQLRGAGDTLPLGPFVIACGGRVSP